MGRGRVTHRHAQRRAAGPLVGGHPGFRGRAGDIRRARRRPRAPEARSRIAALDLGRRREDHGSRHGRGHRRGRYRGRLRRGPGAHRHPPARLAYVRGGDGLLAWPRADTAAARADGGRRPVRSPPGVRRRPRQHRLDHLPGAVPAARPQRVGDHDTDRVRRCADPRRSARAAHPVAVSRHGADEPGIRGGPHRAIRQPAAAPPGGPRTGPPRAARVAGAPREALAARHGAARPRP